MNSQFKHWGGELIKEISGNVKINLLVCWVKLLLIISVLIKTQKFSLISVLVIYMYALEVNACIPGSMRWLLLIFSFYWLGEPDEDMSHELVSMGQCHFVNTEDIISRCLGQLHMEGETSRRNEWVKSKRWVFQQIFEIEKEKAIEWEEEM